MNNLLNIQDDQCKVITWALILGALVLILLIGVAGLLSVAEDYRCIKAPETCIEYCQEK